MNGTPSLGLRAVAVLLVARTLPAADPTFSLTGEVVDAATGKALGARVYIEGKDGSWRHVRSAVPSGTAVPYEKKSGVDPRSIEIHTTVSAHPFVAELPPGRYRVTVERGKEYRASEREIEIAGRPLRERFALERWIDLAAAGWYSGDTHVHRALEEIPALLLAEDLNVAFPLLYWVRRAGVPPTRGDANAPGVETAEPIRVDATHVIVPRNTEYEIFTVDGKQHTLGAVFVLNHRTPLDLAAPPVKPIAETAHRQGALLDLDKHDWPWSMALIPVMGVDLFELANNHLWRTGFAYRKWNAPEPSFASLGDRMSGDEREWILFGLANYYALLDCGFLLRPTAGTASGVHPVPIGFSRVYVRVSGEFTLEAWLQGLAAGRSFVTTGPMLLAELDGQLPGHVFAADDARQLRLSGRIVSETPLESIEVVVNGEVAHRIVPMNRRMASGACESPLAGEVRTAGTSWVALRCFEGRPEGRIRFAHTGPFRVEVPGKPLRPRREEVEYLVQRVRDEIGRSQDLLPPAAIAEYREALAVYERLLPTAR